MNQRTQKEAIIASLKWIVFNLDEPKKNTFEYAIKAYVEAAIAYIEGVIEVKS
jgi:hypothetical protein